MSATTRKKIRDIPLRTAVVAALSLSLAGCPAPTGTPSPNGLTTSYYVYVTGPSAPLVFGVNSATGALTAVASTGASTESTSSVAADPTGRFLYTTNSGSSGLVTAFAIDQSTGALSAIGAPISSGGRLGGMAIDPAGKYLYVSENASGAKIYAFSIAASTGALSEVGSYDAGSYPNDLAIDPSGTRLYAVNTTASSSTSGVSAFNIDGATGELASIGFFQVSNTVRALAIEPSGAYMYVGSAGSDQVIGLLIDRAAGTLSASGYQVSSTEPFDALVDPRGSFVYVLRNLTPATNFISVFKIDKATGSLSSAGPTTDTGENPKGIVVVPTGAYLYAVNNGYSAGTGGLSAYAIDSATGLLTSMTPPALTGNPVGIALASIK